MLTSVCLAPKLNSALPGGGSVYWNAVLARPHTHTHTSTVASTYALAVCRWFKVSLLFVRFWCSSAADSSFIPVRARGAAALRTSTQRRIRGAWATSGFKQMFNRRETEIPTGQRDPGRPGLCWWHGGFLARLCSSWWIKSRKAEE